MKFMETSTFKINCFKAFKKKIKLDLSALKMTTLDFFPFKVFEKMAKVIET